MFWINLYLIVGLLFGEAAIAGFNREGTPITLKEYMVATVGWAFCVMCVIFFHKGK
jgi:glycerol uptake facilitator-like aquaporin